MTTVTTTSEATTTVAAAHDSGVLDWITALGTLGAVAVALLLGLGLREWLRRPKLSLTMSDTASDRVTTATVGGDYAAYLRARVRNGGKTAAKNVSVNVLSVDVWFDDGWERVKPELEGRPLAWSNVDHAAVMDIPPRVERHVDLMSVLRDWGHQGHIPMRLEIKDPMPADHPEFLAPEGWRIRLQVSAENVSALEREVVVVFRGFWPDDPPERVWEVIGIQGPAAPGSIVQPRDPDTELAQLVVDAAEAESENGPHMTP